jgi:ABC-2 type transport system ATP-binding protein
MTLLDEIALSARNLGKRFGNRVAFEDVSFDIAHGEVFGFLGPNGAGKTTTVRTLGTLIAPSTGTATVAGIPLTPENGVQIRQRIAIMPETPGLYLILGVALLVANRVGWRMVSVLFHRERLIAGVK